MCIRDSCNTMPGAHLLNVTDTDAVEGALEKAISRPAELMERMRASVHKHEAQMCIRDRFCIHNRLFFNWLAQYRSECSEVTDVYKRQGVMSWLKAR